MKTLDKIIIFVAALMIIFIITMIIIFCVKDAIPDTLVTCVLGTGTAELIMSALITIAKKKYVKGDDENEDSIE